jgi:tetratricopeptide (TPR) repeat protein
VTTFPRDRFPVWRLVLVAGALASLVALENLGSRLLYEILLRLPGIDKAMHWVQYTGLFLLLWWLSSRTSLDRRARAIVVAGLVLAIGFADEFLQGVLARRSFELADLTVNACGVAAGLALCARPSPRWSAALLTLSLGVTGWLGYRTHELLKDFNRGLLHERAREYAAARDCYARAMAAGHRSVGLLNSAAWVEVEAGGDPRRAVAWAEEGLAKRPHDSDLLDTYGWALHKAGEHARALTALEEAVRLNPRIYNVHYHLGVVHRALGHDDRAAAEFRAQVERLPGSIEAAWSERALAELEGRAAAHPPPASGGERQP